MDNLNNAEIGDTLYISGPMTGITDYNFPQFFKWQCMLEQSGYKVKNPALHDLRKMWKGWVYDDSMWDEVIAEDCAMIESNEVDGIFVLKGWEGSRGALMEIATARKCNKPVYYEEVRKSCPPVEEYRDYN
jgi:hypothetical protein|tara:strand:- start:1015 stop:1407 length:393 start_codon:yes stop_codon:yes gene_type:complete